MTMDVSHKRRDADVTISHSTEQTEITTTKSKRSFDVAFLMLPDEKLKQKQIRAAKQAFVNYSHEINNGKDAFNNNERVCCERTVENDEPTYENRHESRLPTKLIHNPQKPQIFDDPTLAKPKSYEIEDYRIKPSIAAAQEQKSAFTKVNLSKESRLSPNLSISPDLSYQNSLSPSPPIVSRQYHNFPPNILTSNHIFKTQSVPTYQNSFLNENGFNATPSTSIDTPFLVKATPSPEILQPNFAKMRPILQYRPEIPYLTAANTYPSSFQSQEVLKMSQPDIRNPATAAILSSLLPPSFAALSLPAQNVCAKCNISFRMTSDLVYHMRSHHKNDVANDLSKRRREEKLKCPVCAESFRERHHLTRHMTAHQDKEGDVIEPGSKKKAYYKQ